MVEKSKDKVQPKQYPKDTAITEANALTEMAKDIREVRDFVREIPMTEAKRIKVASWDTGLEFRDLLKTVKGIARILGVSERSKLLAKALNMRQSQKAKAVQNS